MCLKGSGFPREQESCASLFHMLFVKMLLQKHLPRVINVTHNAFYIMSYSKRFILEEVFVSTTLVNLPQGIVRGER